VKLRSVFAGMVIASLLACTSPPPPATTPGHLVAHRPPTRKDVIEAVLASQAVKLTVHPACAGVGTEATDTTIGGYLSGFLAELEDGNAKNWLETKVVDAQTAAGAAVWRCELTIRHAAGEDEWGWGVRFDVRQDDGRVVLDSFVCTGAG
jgi:hypothetical protein